MAITLEQESTQQFQDLEKLAGRDGMVSEDEAKTIITSLWGEADVDSILYGLKNQYNLSPGETFSPSFGWFFDTLDLDGNGKIDKSELNEVGNWGNLPKDDILNPSLPPQDYDE